MRQNASEAERVVEPFLGAPVGCIHIAADLLLMKVTEWKSVHREHLQSQRGQPINKFRCINFAGHCARQPESDWKNIVRRMQVTNRDRMGFQRLHRRREIAAGVDIGAVAEHRSTDRKTTAL